MGTNTNESGEKDFDFTLFIFTLGLILKFNSLVIGLYDKATRGKNPEKVQKVRFIMGTLGLILVITLVAVYLWWNWDDDLNETEEKEQSMEEEE